MLAVLGERLPPEVMAQAAGLTVAEIDAALAVLDAVGLGEGDPQ